MLDDCIAIQTGWRTGPEGALTENSTGTNEKSHTKEERMTCKNAGWSLTGWEAALLKRDRV